MAMDVAMQLESSADAPGLHPGGVCYDFRKAFDLVPEKVAFRYPAAPWLSSQRSSASSGSLQ